MNTITLYIGIALKTSVIPKDFALALKPSENGGVDIVRDAPDNMDIFYIDSENTQILGQKRELNGASKFDWVIEMTLSLQKGVSKDQVTFILHDLLVEDGFSITMVEPVSSMYMENVVDTTQSFITSSSK